MPLLPEVIHKFPKAIMFFSFLLIITPLQIIAGIKSPPDTVNCIDSHHEFMSIIHNGFYFFQDTTESLIAYGNKKIGTENNKNIYEQFAGYLLLSLSYTNSANYEMAAKNCLKGLQLINELQLDYGSVLSENDRVCLEKLKSDFKLVLAKIYYEIKTYNRADTLLISVLNTFKKTGDTMAMELAYNELGKSAMVQNKLNISLFYFKESYRLSQLMNDSVGMAKAHNNMAITLMLLKRYTESKHHLKQSLEFYRKENDKLQEARTLYNLGILYGYLDNYDDKLKFFVSAYNILDSLNKPEGKIRVLRNIAQYYFTKNMFQLSKKYLDSALRIAREQNYEKQVLLIYKDFAFIFSRLNDFKKAYQYQILYEKLNDSILKKNQETINVLLVKYETTRYEKIKEHLESEKKIKELLVERASRTKKFIIIFSIFLLVIIVILINRYKFKTKISKQLSEKNAALKRANAIQKLFLSIIGHDLKNPVGTSKNVSEFLSQNYHQLSDKQKLKAINNLAKSARASYLLIDNLLLWARLQNDTIAFEKKEFSFSSAFNEVLSLLATQIEEKSVSAKGIFSPTLKIFTDPNMLKLVLRNLISNAIKFSDSGSEIFVKAKETKCCYEISVNDIGTGIKDEDINNLFNKVKTPLFSNDSKNKGTGLGLVICKEFIERAGGKIYVESVFGKGSIFTFTIPKKINENDTK